MELVFSTRYQVLPDMPPEQFAALKADIEARGVLVPIDVTEDCHILDGHNRYRACRELGIADFPTIVRPGLSEDERRLFARNNNMLRRHLNRQQVRRLIADQLRDTPSWANNRIAQALGVDKKTVQAERRRLVATGEIPKLTRLEGADGRTRPNTRRPAALMAPNAEELQRILSKLSELQQQCVNVADLEGFFSATGLIVCKNETYDPFAHCDEAGKREWLLFTEYQGGERAWPHVEWILQRQFRTPDEWLGSEGRAFRQRCAMRAPSRRYVDGWARFLSAHTDKTLADVEAQLRRQSDR